MRSGLDKRKIGAVHGGADVRFTAAVIPTIAPENFSWVLSHIKCDFIDGSSDSNSVILTKRPFRTRYRGGVLFAQPMSWPGVASPQHSKRHDRGNYVEDRSDHENCRPTTGPGRQHIASVRRADSTSANLDALTSSSSAADGRVVSMNLRRFSLNKHS